jgi:hypothetical protein
MHQLRKGQVQGTSKSDIHAQIQFVNRTFGLAA